MKFNRLLFALLFLLFWTQCQSPSDQIKEAFDTVDKSLDKSNSVLDNSIDGLYASIKSAREKNEALALNADLIYLSTKRASNHIDSLRDVMKQEDSLGTNLTIASKLLVSTTTGDNLRKELMNVYISAKSYSCSNAIKAKLDSALQSYREIQFNKDWPRIYFEQAPTVAAMTVLIKFQNDCKDIATIILTDIKMRLKE